MVSKLYIHVYDLTITMRRSLVLTLNDLFKVLEHGHVVRELGSI